MSTKLYVGGLSWDTTDHSLRQAFETHGSIQDAIIISDRDTGRSRGFGFVTFSEEDSAQMAIAELNGSELDGRSIRVSVAEDRGSQNRGGGGRNASGSNQWERNGRKNSGRRSW